MTREFSPNGVNVIDEMTANPNVSPNTSSTKVVVEKIVDKSNGVVCYVAKNGEWDAKNSPSISCVAPPPAIVPPSAQPSTIDTSKISGKAVSAGAQKKATP